MKPTNFREKCKGEVETIQEVYDDLVYKPSWFDLDSFEIKTIVDIGSLIGTFTLWAKELWPDSVIHAYEPDTESFNYLTKNIHSIKSDEKISAFNLGVWGSNKKIKYHRFSITPGNNTVVYDQRPYVEGQESYETIKPRKMSDVIKTIGGSIDFLKIDCEGSEYNILYSLSKSELNKINFIVIEYHEFDNKQKNTGLALSLFLKKNGFLTQIIPLNIKKKMGIGYIYASRAHLKNRPLQKNFDDEFKKLVQLRKILDSNEEYTNDLIKTIKLKDEISSDLNELVQKNDDDLRGLNELVQKNDDDLRGLNELVQKKDDDLRGLNELVQKKDDELSNTYQLVTATNSELRNANDEINHIKNSVSFRIIRKIGNGIDSCFPNGTKRGELKTVISASGSTIMNEGFRKYFSEVKIKLRRKEFKVLTSTDISKNEEQRLLKIVKDNQKNRLKLKTHQDHEIKKDEFIISSDEKID